MIRHRLSPSGPFLDAEPNTRVWRYLGEGNPAPITDEPTLVGGLDREVPLAVGAQYYFQVAVGLYFDPAFTPAGQASVLLYVAAEAPLVDVPNLVKSVLVDGEANNPPLQTTWIGQFGYILDLRTATVPLTLVGVAALSGIVGWGVIPAQSSLVITQFEDNPA